MPSALSLFWSYLFGENETKIGQAYGFLPLIGPAFPVVLINIGYVLLVWKIGPKYMESRKPYDLKNVLKYYNILQIFLNFTLGIVAVYNIIVEKDIELSCILQLPIGHRRKNIEVSLCYIAYLMKFLDYFDTICFVLRKSFRQVSFLHVYHHLMTTVFPHIYFRYHGFGGHSCFPFVLNFFVHTFMYSYYLLSSLRPAVKQSIWKRYITQLQLAQFYIVMLHQFWPLIFRPDCTYPKSFLILSLIQTSFMIVMFTSFYRKTYSKEVKKSVESDKKIN